MGMEGRIPMKHRAFVRTHSHRFWPVVVFFFAARALAARADETISDTFKPVGENRQVGAGLTAIKPEKGDDPYLATKNFQFAGNDQAGYASSVDHQGGSARLPLPPNAKSVKIELDVEFINATATQWVGIGMGESDPNHTFYREPTGMLLSLNQAGSGLLCAGPDPAKVGAKGGVGSKDKINHLTLFYNFTAKTVSAWVNGIEVCPANTPCPVPIEATFAGFSCYGTNPETKMENFKMTVQTGDAADAKP